MSVPTEGNDLYDLYWCIRLHYQGRERQALKYLWDLYYQSSQEVKDRAYQTLKAVEYNVEVDLLIARAKRGVTSG